MSHAFIYMRAIYTKLIYLGKWGSSFSWEKRGAARAWLHMESPISLLIITKSSMKMKYSKTVEVSKLDKVELKAEG